MNKFIIVSLLCFFGFQKAVIAQEVPDPAPTAEQLAARACEKILDGKLEFLLDGSFQSQDVPAQQLRKLVGCGIDEFDVKFFGSMNSMGAMLTKMAKGKELHTLTFRNLLDEINKVKQTDIYTKMRSITTLSEELANRIGNFKNWPEDERIFEELGSSANIKSKVLNYLRENPDNKKTYKQILESFKKN